MDDFSKTKYCTWQSWKSIVKK